MLCNLVTEYAYLFKYKFSSLTFFICYLASAVLKLLIPLILLLITFKRNVIGKVPKAYIYDID